MSNTGVYDFSQCIVIINHKKYNGPIIINGFAEGSNITVGRNDPSFVHKPSADGKSTTLEKNPIKAGTIVFALNQSTDSLSRMNAIAKYTENGSDSSVIFEITVADKSSGSIHYSQDAVCGQPQNYEYGREENAREFTISCGRIESDVRGAALMSQETAKIIQALGFEVDASRVAS